MRFFSFLFVLVLSVATLSSCRSPKPAPPKIEVSVFEVQPQTIPAEFEFVGVARSSHPVEIRARVEGYLLNIDYTEGSMVEENGLLFRIDPRQFEADLEEAKGALARQEAILWRAKRSLERIEPLYEKHAASRRDLDDAIAQVLAAEASVIMAGANVYNAELNLSYTYVTSPIKGLTARAVFKEGTLITPNVNGLLTEVSVIDPIWVLFSISDNDWLQAQGEKVKSELILPPSEEYDVILELSDGTQFPYTGKVNFTSPTLDPQTGSLTVRATFPNPQGRLLPGQFAKAKVQGATRPDALFVPQTAVFQGQNGMYVFVLDSENKASLRSVEVGEWYQQYWIIKQGLQKGDRVIAEGVNKVKPGVIVTPLPPSKTGPVIGPGS